MENYKKSLKKDCRKKTSRYLSNGLVSFSFTYLSESFYNWKLAPDDEMLNDPLQTAITSAFFSFASDAIQDMSSQIFLDRQLKLKKMDQEINNGYNYNNVGIIFQTFSFNYSGNCYIHPQFNYQIFKPYKSRNLRMLYKRNK